MLFVVVHAFESTGCHIIPMRLAIHFVKVHVWMPTRKVRFAMVVFVEEIVVESLYLLLFDLCLLP